MSKLATCPLLLEGLTDGHVFRKNAAFVSLELATGIEVDQDWASRSHFLDHVLLAHPSVVPRSHVVGVFDPGDSLTARPFAATFWVGACHVLSTGGLHRSVLLEEHAVEEAPTTVASLIDEVAVKALLRRQWHVLPVPNLYPRL